MKTQNQILVSKPLLLLSMVYLYLALFALWPFYLDFRAIIGVPLNPERMVLLLLPCVLLFTLGNTRWRSYVAVRLKPIRKISFFLLLFMFGRFLSAVMSENPGKGVERFVFEVFSFFFLFHFGFLLADSRLSVKWFKLVLMLLGVMLGLFGLLEWLLEGNFLRSLIIPGQSTAGDVALADKFREGVYRTQATFEHPLPYAQYLLLVITLCFMPYILSRYGVFAVSGLLICVLGAISSGSRSGLAGVAIAGFVFWWLKVGRERLSSFGVVIQFTLKVLVLSLIAGVLFYFIFNSGASASSSTMTRIVQLQLGAVMILQSPIWGFGPGQSGEKLLNFQLGDIRIYELTIDNYFLTVMLESGFLGLFAFVAFLYLCFRVLSQSSALEYISTKDKNMTYWYIGWFSAMMSSIFILSIYTTLPMIFFCLGLVVGDGRRMIASYSHSLSGKTG